MSHEIEHLPKDEALQPEMGEHITEVGSTELTIQRFGGRERTALASILFALAFVAGIIFGWPYLLGALPLIAGSMFIDPNQVTKGQKEAITKQLAQERFAAVKREYADYPSLSSSAYTRVMETEMSAIEFPNRWSKGKILLKDRQNYRYGGRQLESIEVKGNKVFHTIYKTNQEEDVWMENFNQALDL